MNVYKHCSILCGFGIAFSCLTAYFHFQAGRPWLILVDAAIVALDFARILKYHKLMKGVVNENF